MLKRILLVSLAFMFLGVRIARAEEITATKEDSAYTILIPKEATLSEIYQSSQKNDWSSIFTRKTNTYNCKANITVLETGSLTINAGETLVIDCPSDDIYILYVKPGGTLRLAGREGSLAKITSNPAHHYYEIYLDRGEPFNNLFINYGEISYMTRVGAVNANVVIDHSELHHSGNPKDKSIPWDKSRGKKRGPAGDSLLWLYLGTKARITNSGFYEGKSHSPGGIIGIGWTKGVIIKNCKLYKGMNALTLYGSSVTLINTAISEITNPKSIVSTSGIGPKGGWASQLTIKYHLNLKVVDKGNPVESARVKIENSSGEEVYSGITDSKGYCKDILITRCILEDKDKNHSPNDEGEVTNYNPHLISVTKGDKTIKKSIKINSAEEIVVSLGDEMI